MKNLKQNTLPKKTLLLWQLRVVMLTTLIVSLCLFALERYIFIGSVAVIISALALLLVVWYLPQFFKSYEIEFKGDAIIINSGVFIRISHIMPYSRLIYAQSFASPLARLFGVSALALKAARSYVLIPEISKDDAQLIIDSLTKETSNEKNI